MERVELTYILPYRENGRKLEKEFRIGHTCNYVRREFYKINSEIETARALWGAYQACIAEIAANKVAGKEYDDIEKKLEEIKEGISKIGSLDFFERRYDVLKTLLVGNGINETDKFVSKEFWDRCVDVDEMIKFMKAAVDKDIPEDHLKKTPGTMN